MPLERSVIDMPAAKRFLLVRKHLKFTQEEMAAASNITQGTVAKIEKGTNDIPHAVMKVLYIKFNVSPLYLVAGEPPMIYKKTSVSTIAKKIPAMEVDIEILKGQVKLLVNFINDRKLT